MRARPLASTFVETCYILVFCHIFIQVYWYGVYNVRDLGSSVGQILRGGPDAREERSHRVLPCANFQNVQ